MLLFNINILQICFIVICKFFINLRYVFKLNLTLYQNSIFLSILFIRYDKCILIIYLSINFNMLVFLNFIMLLSSLRKYTATTVIHFQWKYRKLTKHFFLSGIRVFFVHFYLFVRREFRLLIYY